MLTTKPFSKVMLIIFNQEARNGVQKLVCVGHGIIFLDKVTGKYRN